MLNTSCPTVPGCYPLLFFVTGVHHSGTTWVRAELLRQLGFDNARIAAVRREGSPAACNPLPVVKWPYTDATRPHANRLALTALKLGAMVIGVERLAPETIFSVSKRWGNQLHTLRREGARLCAARCAWRQLAVHAPNRTLLLHYEMLVREQGLPAPLIRRAARLRSHCGFGNATTAATLRRALPPSDHHEQRRAAQQLLQFQDNRTEADAWRHAPPEVLKELLQFDTCVCKGGW